ncbi:alpha/beta fold hydrolase [Agromyces silvae]|uniref:alpha/beta fold hydrolase n=1 Tax=Agromyces silvae TaxID=3388266 RepID=UPI00280BEC77|nr:alpha/beta fold hydrolase [Agromyces protaetiae]
MSGSRDAAERLVLIHGGGVGPWMWRAQADAFSTRFDVCTPTLPGHDPARPGEEFGDHEAAARSVAEQAGLDRPGPPATVVGFSLGGQVALTLAAMHPDRVGRLVVVSSIVEPMPSMAASVGLLRPMIGLTRNERFARAQARTLFVPDADFADYFALSRAMSANTLVNLTRANFTFAVPESVTASERPALLMMGSRERGTLRRGMIRLHDRWAASELAMFEGGGHGVMLSHPDAFDARFSAWLDSTTERLDDAP